jgi:hypothetical protein
MDPDKRIDVIKERRSPRPYARWFGITVRAPGAGLEQLTDLPQSPQNFELVGGIFGAAVGASNI